MNKEDTVGRLIGKCLEAGTDDPVRIFRSLTGEDDVPMNGGIHHIIVPLSLITAYWNVKRDFDLGSYLREAADRAANVPETICGYWGSCGSCIGTGIFLSVITRTGPLSKGRRWGQCNMITSEALHSVAEVGGPRCCKRNAVLAIQSACRYVKDTMGVELHPSEYACGRWKSNPDCIGNRCPFYIDNKREQL